jgi:hypothetical protein
MAGATLRAPVALHANGERDSIRFRPSPGEADSIRGGHKLATNDDPQLRHVPID